MTLRWSFLYSRTTLHVVIGFILTICVGSCNRERNASPAILTNLNLLELAFVLNEQTRLQVNVEVESIYLPDRFDIPRANLTNFGVKQLVRLLKTNQNYTLLTNAGVYTVVPIRKLQDAAYGMNYGVPYFSVTNANPFVATRRLAGSLPFRLSGGVPYPFTVENGPLYLDSDVPHWPTGYVHSVSVTARSATVRDLFCLLFNRQDKWYWAVLPPHKEAQVLIDREYGRGVQLMCVQVFRPEEENFAGVVERRDPESQRWERELFEGWGDPPSSPEGERKAK